MSCKFSRHLNFHLAVLLNNRAKIYLLLPIIANCMTIRKKTRFPTNQQTSAASNVCAQYYNSISRIIEFSFDHFLKRDAELYYIVFVCIVSIDGWWSLQRHHHYYSLRLVFILFPQFPFSLENEYLMDYSIFFPSSEHKFLIILTPDKFFWLPIFL